MSLNITSHLTLRHIRPRHQQSSHSSQNWLLDVSPSSTLLFSPHRRGLGTLGILCKTDLRPAGEAAYSRHTFRQSDLSTFVTDIVAARLDFDLVCLQQTGQSSRFVSAFSKVTDPKTSTLIDDV